MNFIVLGIAFIVGGIYIMTMNPFSLTKAAIACFALSNHPLEQSKFPDGPWQIVSLSEDTKQITTLLETDLDPQSTAPNPFDKWTVIDRPPELNNCECGWKDVADEAEEQIQEFKDDPFHPLERPKPGRGQYGMSSEEIENYLNNVGLDYEVLPGPQMSLKKCAQEKAKESWNELTANTPQKAYALFQAALTVEAACISVQGISNIAVPTTLQAVPGTVSSIGQVFASCTSACALAPTVAQNVRDILSPACNLVSAVSVIGSEQVKDAYKQYAPGFQRNCAVFKNKAGSVTGSLKNRFHRFTSRR